MRIFYCTIAHHLSLSGIHKFAMNLIGRHLGRRVVFYLAHDGIKMKDHDQIRPGILLVQFKYCCETMLKCCYMNPVILE
jgi:hypothetical protein